MTVQLRGRGRAGGVITKFLKKDEAVSALKTKGLKNTLLGGAATEVFLTFMCLEGGTSMIIAGDSAYLLQSFCTTVARQAASVSASSWSGMEMQTYLNAVLQAEAAEKTHGALDHSRALLKPHTTSFLVPVLDVLRDSTAEVEPLVDSRGVPVDHNTVGTVDVKQLIRILTTPPTDPQHHVVFSRL